MDFSIDRCKLFTNGINLELEDKGLVLTRDKEEYYLLYSNRYKSYYLAVKLDSKFYKLHRIVKKKYDLFLNKSADIKFNEIIIQTYIISVTIEIIDELHSDIYPATIDKFKIINTETDESI